MAYLWGIKFSLAKTNPSAVFAKTCFTEMANGYQRNPLFHWFSWWFKPYPLKQVRSTTFTTAPKLIRKPPGTSCFFFGRKEQPFWWVEQEDHSYTLSEESIEYENCFTLSDGQPPNISTPTIAPPSDRGHFVLLLLDDPNASWSAQIPFQIDSAASC